MHSENIPTEHSSIERAHLFFILPMILHLFLPNDPRKVPDMGEFTVAQSLNNHRGDRRGSLISMQEPHGVKGRPE